MASFAQEFTLLLMACAGARREEIQEVRAAYDRGSGRRKPVESRMVETRALSHVERPALPAGKGASDVAE